MKKDYIKPTLYFIIYDVITPISLLNISKPNQEDNSILDDDGYGPLF